MKLSELLREDKIILDFKAKNKDAVLEVLVDKAVNGLSREALLSALREREKLGSTGVGFGVAVPHVRLDTVTEPVVVFGRTREAVDFDAMDGEPCRLFFLVLGPTRQDVQDAYLSTMAKISRLMRQEPVRMALLQTSSPREVLDLIRQREQ